MKPYMLILLLVCTLPGCVPANTCVGSPWAYWHHGFFAVVGFGIVCGLILFGLCGLCAGEEHTGFFFAGLAFWLVAMLLLQALPHTESGVRFVPLAPWHYGGWIARIVSGISWICIGLACMAVFSSLKADRVGAAIAMLIAMALNGLLSFATPLGTTQLAASPTCQDKIAQWEQLRQQRAEALSKLSADKVVLLTRIRGLGVSSKKDLMAHPVGRTLVEELEQLSRQTAQLQGETDAIAAVLERAQSMLRSIERESLLKGLGVAEPKRNQLSLMDHALREELRNMTTPDAEVRLDKVLDKVFAPTR
jgi:hypothetical protein